MQENARLEQKVFKLLYCAAVQSYILVTIYPYCCVLKVWLSNIRPLIPVRLLLEYIVCQN